jgi:hypothetical protein
MTRDDIIRMAKEAGFEDGYGNHLFPPGDYIEEVIPVTDEIVRFAALVAAAEREACAKVAENGLIGHTIAIAIRARGE